MTETIAATALVEDLAPLVRGGVISREEIGYDDARKVYNAMVDKRPLAIARCSDQADVIAAIRFAAKNGLEVAIRGGGHNQAGLGSVDDGLVIDLSPMRWTHVDPDARTVTVGGGCQLGDIDHATHAFGMATPTGILSTTGIGLVLGGGIGHLTRKYGLSVDNILAAEVVLANGNAVRASEDEHPDLFWALRGGGGNFGVVTSLTFRLHDQATIIGGPILWPLDQAAEVLPWYRDFLPAQPDDLNGFFAFLTVKPGPPFPEHLHLQKMCGVVWCFTGDPSDADAVLKPAREVGSPALDGIMTMPLPALQSAFDDLYPAGNHSYWRGDFVVEIPDAAIDAHVELAKELPTPLSTMHMYPVDGAASRVPNDATPWAYRDAKWATVFVGVDPDPSNAALIKRWTIDYFEALHPYAMDGSYVNFLMDEGRDRVHAAYRENFTRLAEIKATYDPDNFFHVNQNIRPA
jgi:FAD/FMN-containing dehydrogenase